MSQRRSDREHIYFWQDILCDWSDPRWAEMMPYCAVALSLYGVGIPLGLWVSIRVGYQLAERKDTLCFKADLSHGLLDPLYHEALS